MGYYSPQEPQRQEPTDPYKAYNPYDSQSYAAPSSQQQQTYTNDPGRAQEKVRTGNDARFAAQWWNALTQFLGMRGLLAVAGSVLALLAFFIMPYYSLYTGYFLAAQAYDDKWWLELVLPVVSLVIVFAQRFVPRLQQMRRRLALVILGSGLLGLLVNFWFMNMVISSNYWRFGTWSYFVGMALVALAGLLSLI